MSPKKVAKASVRRTTGKASQLSTAEERAVMKETLNERRRAVPCPFDACSQANNTAAAFLPPPSVRWVLSRRGKASA